ncbi:MAG: amidase [bacterium]
MDKIIDDSALDLSRKIAERDITPPQVLEFYIDRIRSINPTINAVVVELFEEARRRARRQYETLDDRHTLPVFYGVPITIKEMISVEGQPITCGSVYRSGAESTSDAEVVREVKQCGANPFGLTNVPELGLWIESTNPVYGTTNNPHDLDRTAGGSSGGEAAIIASGGSPMGIGSDLGGSIRIPSSFCGIYGHKPSTSTVRTKGHFPQEYSESRMDFVPSTNLISIGPMTRRSVDLLPLLNCLRSRPQSREKTPAYASDIVDFSDVTAHLLPAPDISYTSAANGRIQASVEQAGQILQDHGASVKSFPEDFFQQAPLLYMSYLKSQGLPSVGRLAGSGDHVEITGEFARKLVSRSRHTMPMLTMCLLDTLFSPSQRAIDKAVYKTNELRDELSSHLSPENLLIMPVYPTEAPQHGRTLLSPFDLMYSAIFNILDFPVTTAPILYNNDDAPVGVQIVAPMDKDEVGIAAAMACEESLGSPRRAS